MNMDWFKKHVDTVIILSAFASSVFWMNGKFNEVDRRFGEVDRRFAEVGKQFSEVHEQLSILKTVLIMKNIMPVELAQSEAKQ